jgi:hypothetical protein
MHRTTNTPRFTTTKHPKIRQTPCKTPHQHPPILFPINHSDLAENFGEDVPIQDLFELRSAARKSRTPEAIRISRSAFRAA